MLRRWGALVQPACRTSNEQPQADLTQAVPVPKLGFMPRLELAYGKGREARFEWGEAA